MHSGVNIGEEGIRRRAEVIREQLYKPEVNQDNSDPSNVFFSLDELHRAIQRGGKTAPGKDELGYFPSLSASLMAPTTEFTVLKGEL